VYSIQYLSFFKYFFNRPGTTFSKLFYSTLLTGYLLYIDKLSFIRVLIRIVSCQRFLACVFDLIIPRSWA